jgi:hypothetical protein
MSTLPGNSALLGEQWASIASDSIGLNRVAIAGPGSVWTTQILTSSNTTTEYHYITSSSNTLLFDGVPIGQGSGGGGATGPTGQRGPTGPTGPTGTFSFSGVTGAVLYSPDGLGVTGTTSLLYNSNTLVSEGLAYFSTLTSQEVVLPYKPYSTSHWTNQAINCNALSNNFWNSIASDSTGSNLIAVSPTTSSSSCWTGYNNGVAWTWTDQSVNWNAFSNISLYGCASDATGSNVVICGSNIIWTGYNYGVNWSWTDQTVNCNSLGNYEWRSVASDSTGSNLVIVSPFGFSGGHIWTGYNNGVEWIWNDQAVNCNALSNYSWNSVASDITGSNLVVVSGNNGIWTGYNNGTAWVWTDQSVNCNDLSTSGAWRSVTSDSTGTKIAAVNDNFIWTGYNNGEAWIWTKHNVGSGNLLSITSDFNGSRVFAVENGTTIWKGYNNGSVWTWTDEGITNSNIRDFDWLSITSDYSGSNLAAAVGYQGSIWTGHPSIDTVTQYHHITSSSNTLLFDGVPIGQGATGSFSFTGVTGSILYSPDGVGLTGSSKLVFKEDAVPTSITAYLQAITYNSVGGYVAVGYDNIPANTIYLTSPDGVTWIGGTGPIQGQLYGVTYGSAGGYVAVGNNDDSSIYLRSPDGVTWTGGIGSIPQSQLYGITYDSAGGYVAVGYDGITSDIIYLTSPDGISWTDGRGPVTGQLFGITYSSAGGYVAVGYTYQNGQNRTFYLTTPDGVSWTGSTGPIPGVLKGIAYAPAGGYVAVGYDDTTGDTIYLSSPDGVTWTGGTGPIQGQLNGITYSSAGGYVAVGNDSTSLNYLYLSSPDGVTWTGGTGPNEGSIVSVTYGSAGGYVAIGYDLSGPKQLTSTDGVSWTRADIAFSTAIKTSLKVDKLIDNTQSAGAPGQVLTAGPAGEELIWADINLAYNPAYPSYWESPAPATVQEALDRISKYIYNTSSAVIPL